jgi:hypothetical protein
MTSFFLFFQRDWAVVLMYRKLHAQICIAVDQAAIMDSDHCKTFIGGISWETSEERLRDYFSKYRRSS